MSFGGKGGGLGLPRDPQNMTVQSPRTNGRTSFVCLERIIQSGFCSPFYHFISNVSLKGMPVAFCGHRSPELRFVSVDKAGICVCPQLGLGPKLGIW